MSIVLKVKPELHSTALLTPTLTLHVMTVECTVLSGLQSKLQGWRKCTDGNRCFRMRQDPRYSQLMD